MVGVIRRMNALREILWIRNGPGAAILPPNVTKIHLEFARKMEGGHMGPRKFWRENLPRLKFWNPAVPMIVNRIADPLGPAILTVYLREGGGPLAKADVSQPSSATDGMSKAPPPANDEKVLVVDMKGLRSDEILKEFLKKTSAVPVETPLEEKMEIQEIEDLRRRGQIDRERNAKMLQEQRREKARLAQAMSEAAAIKASAT
ncbi:CI-B8 domain-containing protein [Echria macrotheca]|uniref:CI-B8 domain-containing protein n=1 Tax=Echria macrotheca TaxID=438768 RepID=A0AAJ0F8P9_9PEZI|nr:CI-B8 domain-containing protein [Echria macrotheca]